MKKRYLCPVCDQELTVKSYCPECRRIRREPIIYEGWLLPNESDQEGIFQRAAEERTAAEKNYSRTQRGKQAPEGGRVYDSRYLDTCGSGHAHTYGVPNEDPHKKKRGAKDNESGKSSRGLRIAVILVMVCITVTALWKTIWNFAGEMITDIQERVDVGNSGDDVSDKPERDDGEGEISGDGFTDNFYSLSEAEILAAGEPCNGYRHYDMDGEEYLARLTEYIRELWPEEPCDFEWQESYNQVYQNGSDRYSYYERSAECSLGRGVSYTVTCDTATGEVMKVDIRADREENFGRAFLLAACALEPDRDRNEVWENVQSLLSGMGEEEYYFGDWGISEVYLSAGNETYYYGSMNCLPEYDKYKYQD